MSRGKLITRQKYLDEALLFRDTDLIKVVTGVRRCGKSCLLDLVREKIAFEEGSRCECITLNLESKTISVNTENGLYNYVRDRLAEEGRTYIFLDEPQRIKGWQNAVNAMRVDFDCDIYLTGSNAFLLSSELSTYLSGRYVEISMFPLVFAEYCDFCNIQFERKSDVAIGPDGNPVLFSDLFNRYLRFGGMPALASLDTNQQQHSLYLSGVYEAIATRDILNRPRPLGQSKVTDPILLERITNFLADNIGNALSANRIANTLTSSGSKTTNKTVESYVKALNDAYLFYRTHRFDIHGKDLLKSSPKEYIVDLGFRFYLSGYRVTDIGRAFENAVYLQLRYDGWQVHVGKLYGKEIDFIAVKDGRTLYLQVADEMFSEDTRAREIAPLVSIKDAHRKAVVVRQGDYDSDINGVPVVPARQFFLEGISSIF